MAETVKASSFGRIKGTRPGERPKYSGTTSLNEGRPYTVIVPHGAVHHVIAITPALAIRMVTPRIHGAVVIEGHPTSVQALAPCARCGNPVWQGDKCEVRRQAGAKPKTWITKVFCEDCC